MKNIDKFLESPGFKEKGIIAAYLQRENRYMTVQRDIIRCITVKEEGKGKYSLAFSDAVSEHLEEFRATEAAIARDQVKAELSPTLAQLEGRLLKINQVLDRY